MKILFLSAWFPYPPDNGSRIRVYNLLKVLAREHEVYLVSLLQEDSRRADADKLQQICRVVSLHESRWFKPGTLRSLAGFFSSKPRSFVDTYDPEIAVAVRAAIDRVLPDVVVASQIGSMVYVPDRCGVPVVFEELEIGSMYRSVAEGRGVRHARARLTFAKHRRFVRDLLGRADVFTCVSAKELDLANRLLLPPVRGTVVPNGVDTDYYNDTAREPEQEALVYNGALTYNANLDAVRYFASEILPILRLTRSRVRLRVTGRTEGTDLEGIVDCPEIELTGYVDDIRTVLSRSAVCVVPLRQGGGSRLKILEAMASGVPVVSTSVGAEGLAVEHGRHVLIADSPADFARAVDQLLGDVRLADTLARNAKELVRRAYDWSSIGGLLIEAVESAASSGPRGGTQKEQV
ncbi:MAG: glycosyltransferase family 4 protein [Armatimonadota bacterium]